MVTMESLEAQLKKVNFNSNGWGRTEARELVNILHSHEEIYDLVNGYYEGGFALLVATNIRLILVDKKPLNFLTVEDLRFEMINEIQYSHRIIGAHINVSTGNNKTMKFTSLNQARLRKTIGHVQSCIADSKKSESEHAQDQKGHLAQINQQLQSYLIAQHQQQQSLSEQLQAVRLGQKSPDEVKIEHIKPSHELSDYLFAQSLLAQAKQTRPDMKLPDVNSLASEIIHTAAIINPDNTPAPVSVDADRSSNQMDDLYAEGMKEIFGKQASSSSPVDLGRQNTLDDSERAKRAKKYGKMASLPGGIEINPFTLAYKITAKAMKKRKVAANGGAYQPSKSFESYEASPQLNNPALHLPA